MRKNLGGGEGAVAPVTDEVVGEEDLADDVGAVVGNGLVAHGGASFGELVGDAVDADEAFVSDGGAVVDGDAFGGGVVEDNVSVLYEGVASFVGGVDDGDHDTLTVHAGERSVGEGQTDGCSVGRGGSRSADGGLDGLSALGEDDILGGDFSHDGAGDGTVDGGDVQEVFVELSTTHALGAAHAEDDLEGGDLRHAAHQVDFGALVVLEVGFRVEGGDEGANVVFTVGAFHTHGFTEFTVELEDSYKFCHNAFVFVG